MIKHEKLSAQGKAKGPEKKKQGKQLLDDGESELCSVSSLLYLEVKFGKIPEKFSLMPVRMPIPHPFRDAANGELSVCVITKDPQRYFKDQINPMGLKSVTKIIGISKLRTKFKSFEAKRVLRSSFDLFVADSRIVPMLPKVLGKTFFAKKKQPVTVQLEESNSEGMKKEIKNAIEATFFFRASGSTTSIIVGSVGQRSEHIASNIESVIKQLGSKIPGGLSAIRLIHLKTKDSAAIPIYVRSEQAVSPTTSSHE